MEENIHLSPAKNEPLVAQKIFMDRGAQRLRLPAGRQSQDRGQARAAVERAGRRRLRLRRDSRGPAEGRARIKLPTRRMRRKMSSTAPRKRCWRSSRTARRKVMSVESPFRTLHLDRGLLLSVGMRQRAAQQILLDKPVRGGRADRSSPTSTTRRSTTTSSTSRSSRPTRTAGRSSRSCATSRT